MDLETLKSDFGKWSVALVPTPLDEAMRCLGIEECTPVAEPLVALEENEDLGTQHDGGAVFLIARRMRPGWTLIVEIDGATGWVMGDAEVLQSLSTRAERGCTAFSDLDRSGVIVAEPVGAVSGIDPETGRRWGSPSPQLTDDLNKAGFSPEGYGLADRLAGQSPAQLALIAIRASTGINLDRNDFMGEWIGGLARRGHAKEK